MIHLTLTTDAGTPFTLGEVREFIDQLDELHDDTEVALMDGATLRVRTDDAALAPDGATVLGGVLDEMARYAEVPRVAEPFDPSQHIEAALRYAEGHAGVSEATMARMAAFVEDRTPQDAAPQDAETIDDVVLRILETSGGWMSFAAVVQDAKALRGDVADALDRLRTLGVVVMKQRTDLQLWASKAVAQATASDEYKARQ